MFFTLSTLHEWWIHSIQLFIFEINRRNARESRLLLDLYEENMSLVCNCSCHAFRLTKLRRRKVISIDDFIQIPQYFVFVLFFNEKELRNICRGYFKNKINKWGDFELIECHTLRFRHSINGFVFFPIFKFIEN